MSARAVISERSATHVFVSVRSGARTWLATWAKGPAGDAPNEREALDAWALDTNEGRSPSKNWRRS